MFNKQLYNTKYHQIDLSQYSFLITGGAGFIGSNLVEYLLRYNAKEVRVLDNLSNGYIENIKDFLQLPNFQFINGDIRDLAICREAVEGIDFISHQAALGSVPRSIADPISSNSVNIDGFLNLLNCAKESETLKRFVYAASSSTYGNSSSSPKIEGQEGEPLSPYAVTKLVNELYALVFSKVYKFHTVGLRYFNVFGPKQNPNNPYAAVIPIFCKHFINGTNPIINGDGETSRDFTFIENVVRANIKTLFHPILNNHEVFNVACGSQISLNQIVEDLNILSGKELNPIYQEFRIGDIKHSRASIDKISSIGYKPTIEFAEGLKLVYNWYKNNIR